ncbi:P-loop containing nucleoside triphosphate hydrolase protein [Punctularia strigosozonata HHB-11173 SS5]|uniref:P-loop containing nucleoside triphosphate hydrolase protein n=1 Tax=Punctularia strigosozonata (strain HHB-11173) TaxID=741275 RepID=UPI00044186DB|nr:P-loop containing nucleoside triphosphate hydrolase protein [Punctularia strigosozonata HHB-11173 SS5]EIN07962.1 P-loop containing nucleoside triphosphate hydrolase protein [Punctularia strigosozonata HHB-11173 SS5]
MNVSDAPSVVVLRAIPFAIVLASVAHFAYLVIHYRCTPRHVSEGAVSEEQGWRTRLAYSGGFFGVFLRVLRVAGTATYAVSALISLFSIPNTDCYLHIVFPAAVSLYATILGAFSLFSSRKWQRISDAHIGIVLLAHFFVSAYFDLRVLSDVGEHPTGRWYYRYVSELLYLFVICIFVPLAIPGPQSSDPIKSASLGSILTWDYFTPAIWYAARHGHLPSSKLPPLDPHDDVSYLITHTFPKIDPLLLKRKRHVIWSLLDIFKWDYAVMTTLTLCESVSYFLAPIGVRQILTYLEDPSAATVQPWVWVVWIGVGPMVYSITAEWYLYLATKMLRRAEAIVTQLAFRHALRIRMKGKEERKKEGTGERTTEVQAEERSASPTATSSTVDGGSETYTDASEERSASPTSSSATVTPSEGGVPDNAKAKQDKKDEDNEKQNEKQMIGRINNIITTDVSAMQQARDFPQLLSGLSATIISVFFLYDLLGWSAFVGIAVAVITLPVPAWAATQMMDSTRKKMAVSDARVQAVTQTMSVVRMIKLFAWEHKSVEKLEKLRAEELSWIRYNGWLYLSTYVLNQILPLCNIVAIFGVYTLVMKQELTAARIFTSISVFAILQRQISQLVFMLPTLLNAKVSLDRINEFLNDTELITPEDGSPSVAPSTALVAPDENNSTGFCDAVFTWDRLEDDGAAYDPKKRDFRLRIDKEIIFEKDAVNLIVGPTGAGKTSVLLALLGEMHYSPQSGGSWYNLPRGGGIAYAAQESWVLNETIQDNIVFGSPFDQERYQKVLEQCALVQDLGMFAAGDQTEVGEKGLTLSGGQKARVTLARAVYSKAKIVLLDDILAALDVHTARHVVDKCLKGDLLRDRTVLLVTHNLALARLVAKKVIRVDGQGHVTAEASLAEAIEHDDTLRQELAKEEETVQKAQDRESGDQTTKKDDASTGKLIVAEDIAHGTVSLEAVMLYLRHVGGPWFWFFRLSLVVSGVVFKLYEPYYLGLWSNEYENHEASEVPASKYLCGYAILCLFQLASDVIAWIVWLNGSLHASGKIHRQLVESVFGATFRWLDTVPVSRVIARCTKAKDLQSVDEMIRQIFSLQQMMIVNIVLRFAAIVYVVGWSVLAAGLAVLVIALGVGRFYIAAQRELKREQSVAKAPVLSLFGAGLVGLASIRAYGAQDYFSERLITRINHYTVLTRNFYNINRWVGVRVDGLGAVFSSIVAAGIVYGGFISVGNAGFALSQVLGFATEVFVFVRVANMAEVECNSLERILDFLKIEHEPEPKQDGVPPAYWPASGSLRAEKLSARYSPDSVDVLRDISFDIKSGERVGVVGRTGAGKSTISLALLRALITRGKVFYDGIDIHAVNLDALRANVTLIPQHPDLLAGSVRENLDPFGEHDDAALNDALRSAGLERLQKEGDAAAAITLDSEVDAGGSNFSHGQRQIIALARAYVRRSKLMIMDEATAAIDYETDSAIQESIRANLGSDITIITIAHRLQTIMDSDKIMVLDAGRLVEFGSPRELLLQKKGLFFELVEKSHDKDVLYDMVKS